jgi:LuxR family quorum-sensing system transcriptional regulator CciR
LIEFARVDRFVAEVAQVSTPAALRTLVGGMTLEMGFDYFALVHHVDLAPMRPDLRHMNDGSLLALTNYPPDWVRTYVTRNYVASDPVHVASRQTNVGFRWSEMERFVRLTPEHRSICEESVQAGIEDGFTVPANIPGEATGSCSFALRSGAHFPEESLLVAQMVGAYAFEAGRRMVSRARRARRSPARPLTPRQLECLVLVAQGKTDAEIARQLGVHEQTVTQHLNEARERCGVSRRPQLLVHAIYNGFLSLSDIYGGEGT